MSEDYVLKVDGYRSCPEKSGSALRRWCRAGVALIAAVLAATGPVYGADAEQIVSSACAACHGADGRSVAPMFPNLAGQQRAYLKKQLNDFIDGRRVNNIMSPNVAALKSEDVDALAAYFSAKSPVPNVLAEPLPETGTTPGRGSIAEIGAGVSNTRVVSNKSGSRKAGAKDAAIEKANTAWLIEAGQTFFKNGNVETGVPGCTGCHREGGVGNKAYPRLAGQSSTYISQQLGNFKTGARANDNYGLMRAVVTRMSDQEIEAVSAYLAAAGQ